MGQWQGPVENLVSFDRAGFWRGKRVLLTGHTGFKGAWLALWLDRLGADVHGISLPPSTEPSLYTLAAVADSCHSVFCDIRQAVDLRQHVQAVDPDIVIHMAAQSLVRTSHREPLETIQTNVMGTANLLEALRGLGRLKVALMVTTDKVYRNTEQGKPFNEDDTLGGVDPYSASKAASELIINSYRDAFLAGEGVVLAVARAGNVIGGGDWSQDRLFPDAIRAWQAGRQLEIRRPDAVRPWQHVLEPLLGYLTLVEKLWLQPELAGAFNFGPANDSEASVRDVTGMAAERYGNAAVLYGEDSEHLYEAVQLTLDTGKAKRELGVLSLMTLAEAVAKTIDWYLALQRGDDARELCLADIIHYEQRL